MNVKAMLIVCTCAALVSCRDTFEYSPHQRFDRTTPENLNATNIEQLLATPPDDDTVTIVFAGDCQRFYDEVDAFVDRVNAIHGIDVVILAGDVTDFGLVEEFELMHERLEKLRVPYIAAPGNHDVLGGKAQIFERVFGPLNFSFVYGGIKFVMHNTNGIEFPNRSVPDMEWLALELLPQEDVQYFLPVSHIPPYDPAFNQELVGPYTSLFSETPSLIASLHGHVHNHFDDAPFQDGVRYITNYAFDQRAFLVLKIVDGNLIKSGITY